MIYVIADAFKRAKLTGNRRSRPRRDPPGAARDRHADRLRQDQVRQLGGAAGRHVHEPEHLLARPLGARAVARRRASQRVAESQRRNRPTSSPIPVSSTDPSPLSPPLALPASAGSLLRASHGDSTSKHRQRRADRLAVRDDRCRPDDRLRRHAHHQHGAWRDGDARYVRRLLGIRAVEARPLRLGPDVGTADVRLRHGRAALPAAQESSPAAS